MERKIMERRTVLKGGAAAIGMLGGASTAMVTGVEQASADAATVATSGPNPRCGSTFSRNHSGQFRSRLCRESSSYHFF